MSLKLSVLSNRTRKDTRNGKHNILITNWIQVTPLDRYKYKQRINLKIHFIDGWVNFDQVTLPHLTT